MDVYLMQHGAATSAEEDPARPLTQSGRRAAKQVAARAAGCGVQAGRCIHSGKLRAEQTARIIGEALGARVESRAGLNPSDPVLPIADLLGAESGSAPGDGIVLIGHLPFLDRLASVLIVGQQDAHPIRFQNAGLVKLVPKDEASGFAVSWVLTPDLAAYSVAG
jgi:phosphohistidine phosphatase